MQKLSLAFVRQNYRLDGGAERSIVEILQTLNIFDEFKLNIISRNWKYKHNINLKIHICNPKKYGKISRERGFAIAARKFWKNQKFDIIQSHERITGCDIFRAGDGVHRVWLKKRQKISRYSLVKKWIFNLSPYHRYLLYAEEQMYGSTDLKAVICNSKMVKNEIIRYFHVDQNKIHLIYNTINTRIFRPATDNERYMSRKILNLPQNKIVFIFVGSGFYRKGLKYAIQSISGIDRYLIVVGWDKNYAYYKSLAKDLNCFDKIRFVGKQNNVQNFYFASDALLLPTIYDPCPNVVCEAMACGLSVITSDSCGGSEFIEEGKEGYICDPFNSKNLKQLVESICSIKINPNMGLSAYHKIKCYNRKYLYKSLKLLYQKVKNIN